MGDDEYQLKGLSLSGWALDIGAHIGTIGIALAVDNPDLRVICVEPVPDNADLIRRAVEANRLTERVFVEEAGACAAGTTSVPVYFGYTDGGTEDKGYIHQNRFIGNIWHEHGEGEVVQARGVSIADLMARYLVPSFAFCKIDAEGAEWEFLRTGAGHIERLVGEYHDRPFSSMYRLLSRTHTTSLIVDHGGNGLFRAVHK